MAWLFKLASKEIFLSDIFSCFVLAKKKIEVFVELYVHVAKTNNCKKSFRKWFYFCTYIGHNQLN